MYACTHETGRGFFKGMCRLENRPPTFRDPPPPLAIRELTHANLTTAAEHFEGW
jgi:hypothetical protein